MKLRQNRKFIIALCISLLIATLAISLLTVHVIHYNNEGIEETAFLPTPDSITIYFTQNGKSQKSTLRGEDMQNVLTEFEKLKDGYVKPIVQPEDWDKKAFVTQRKSLGGVEFHYKERRNFKAGLITKEQLLKENRNEFLGLYLRYGFDLIGSADSVLLVPYDTSSVKFARGLNGDYHAERTVKFTPEAVSAFWVAINNCVK